MIERRVQHPNLPDLFLMDGGKGQVSVIRNLLEDIGLDISVFGLYKDDKHRTKGICSDEELFEINKKSDVYKLIYEIQEEVHRFAIEYHRSLREKHLSRSELDDIPGVGTKKKMILLKEFKSVKNIKEKTEEELSAIKGIDKRTAKNIVEYFDKKNPIRRELKMLESERK